ncbi:hypothetical protein H7J07_06720 [Mycobacterium koreense]|uniref:Uncharacterized protein n=1 Tax=Mycolicibacillus koreensis TaxID=1069220 RepID=A0A7I7SJI5_9MYCO|nr:hypothetical protein [Mycolicibacillus koreensis]MCV7247912.1 hypothetical protein [Mycolicibacillus koreensis]OSC23889.1 hypothetical protein B8W67_19740 [Mycolicibacillus koreensis]BBY56155.1 hypothetical protein MKOR_34060 [Mycolicibacillus koreensis]
MSDNTPRPERIDYDLDFLEDFASNLRELISGFEAPGNLVGAIKSEFHQAASTGTTGRGLVSPIYRPLGEALDTAVDKTQSNLQELVEALENDVRAIEELVSKVRAHESDSARDIGNTDVPEQVV